jgi:hypothetical protein
LDHPGPVEEVVGVVGAEQTMAGDRIVTLDRVRDLFGSVLGRGGWALRKVSSPDEGLAGGAKAPGHDMRLSARKDWAAEVG